MVKALKELYISETENIEMIWSIQLAVVITCISITYSILTPSQSTPSTPHVASPEKSSG